MSGPSPTDHLSTHMLVEAGDVLRKLNPPIVATLLYLLDDATYTQEEIASNIGSSRSSISQYQQSLSALPLPLAKKQGYRYEITTAGEKITGYLGEMGDRLGVDLYDLDWQSDAAHEEVASLLTPLYDSRIAMPFFVLDALSARSTESNYVDLLSTPQQVSIQKIIQDVDVRQQDRGEQVTSSQVRQMISRFSNKGTIERYEDHIKLTEKGKEHAYLLNRVVKLIENRSNDIHEGEALDTTSSEAGNLSDETQREQSIPGSAEKTQQFESLTQQIHPQGFLGNPSQSLSTEQSSESGPLMLVPAYCIDRPDEGRTSDSSSPTPQPVLPLRSRTVGELSTWAERLVQEYDEDTQLTMYWMLQTPDGTTLTDAKLSPTDSTESEDSQ